MCHFPNLLLAGDNDIDGDTAIKFLLRFLARMTCSAG